MNLPMLFGKLLNDIYTAYIYGFLRVLWKYVSQTTYFHKNMLQFLWKFDRLILVPVSYTKLFGTYEFLLTYSWLMERGKQYHGGRGGAWIWP